MIKTISLINFYSFNETTINLNKEINVLIGINGSGKTNFLRAIRLLKTGISKGELKKLILEEWGGIDEIFFKGSDIQKFQNSIGLEYTFDHTVVSKYGFHFHQDIIYKIVIIKSPGLNQYFTSETIKTTDGYKYLDFINGRGKLTERVEKSGIKYIEYDDYDSQELVLSKVFDSERYWPLDTLRKAITDIEVYDYFDTTASSPLRKAMKATSGKRLLSDGSNLPQILNTLKISHKKDYNQLIQLLNDVNENFQGFDFHFLGSGNFELMLDESKLNSSIHVTNISDGTLRYLCLLSIMYNPDRGSFICIDEPEVGLHPDMTLNITNAIKNASLNSTMIIATHSESILDAVEVEDVRVFEKESDNSTVVRSFKNEEFEKWYDEYNLGRMWRKGDIGGNRW
ncbi:MAG: hypothetical protein FJY07_11780 [Bacteroidetes bacterium]|nr:hypothetical protein [Bacteroidota bacterium]